MTETSEADKERNREIAQNEEAKQVTGSVRVSTWAVAVVVIVGGILFTLGWLAPLGLVPAPSLRVIRHPLAGQELIGRLPAGQGGHAAEPGVDGRMARREIKAVLVARIVQVGHHRDIGDRRPRPDRKGIVLEMSVENAEEILEPPAKMLQHLRIVFLQ